MTANPTVLERLETYYDAAPRARSRIEEIGPFTLFVAESGWPYYARPRLGEKARATVDDVRSVLARQRQLGVPQALEWVAETTPGLVEVVRSAGAEVHACPLLVLDGDPVGEAGTARMLDPGDWREIAAAHAAIAVSFHHAGTSSGAAGVAERDEEARASAARGDSATHLQRLTDGTVRTAVVYARGAPQLGPVGGGSHIPVGDVTEIVGVGVLPAFRRQGLGGQLSYALAMDALTQGVVTVFCSAQSDDVARVYEAVGFRRVGTACVASVEPAGIT